MRVNHLHGYTPVYFMILFFSQGCSRRILTPRGWWLKFNSFGLNPAFVVKILIWKQLQQDQFENQFFVHGITAFIGTKVHILVSSPCDDKKRMILHALPQPVASASYVAQTVPLAI
jgi:hypothetical protein